MSESRISLVTSSLLQNPESSVFLRSFLEAQGHVHVVVRK